MGSDETSSESDSDANMINEELPFNVKYINIKGSGTLTVYDTIDTDLLSVTVSGTGGVYFKMNEKVTVKNVNISVSGSGDIKSKNKNP